MAVSSLDRWPPKAPTSPAPPPGDAGPAGLRLHHKGMLVLASLAVLIALLFGLVLAYRASMEQDFDRLERTRQSGVLAADLAQTQALVMSEVGNQLGGGGDVESGPIDRLLTRMIAQAHAFAAAGNSETIDVSGLSQARAEFVQHPDRVSLMALRERLEESIETLGRQSQARELLAVAQVGRVHERGRAVAVALAAAALLGTTLIGVVLVFFFSRLSADIGRLRARALAVVGGDRRAAQTIDRDDELGELGTAIDATVAALAARERDLEIERRHVFHQEKMATIGALAAGVLNDIGNPIAAIDGFARAMRDERDAGALRFDNALCDPEHILEQTARLQYITRQIAQLAAPPSSQPQLLSLNDVVRTALLLAHFDARVSGVRIDTELDPQLPAIDGVGDRLVQLALNLLVNAADASRGQAGRAGLIVVRTARAEGQVEMSIADNGCGMDTQTLARAYEPLFTTKPAGQGTGLGLPLCRDIAHEHGGTLRLESVLHQGTTATLCLPLAASQS
jgi:signal transduction histidine kinase